MLLGRAQSEGQSAGRWKGRHAHVVECLAEAVGQPVRGESAVQRREYLTELGKKAARSQSAVKLDNELASRSPERICQS